MFDGPTKAREGAGHGDGAVADDGVHPAAVFEPYFTASLTKALRGETSTRHLRVGIDDDRVFTLGPHGDEAA